jgi:hypothetical protein
VKITIESTSQFATVNGVPARIWEGASESGVEVICWITRIAVRRSDDCSQFDRELAEQRPPSEGALSFPLRMVL